MSEYEAAILLWCEHHAALLRRVARGEAVNKAPDWDHISDEVQSVGSERLRAVESLLLQAVGHMLQAAAWPLSREVPHWQADARLLRAQADLRVAPSMRQRLNLARLYAKAV